MIPGLEYFVPKVPLYNSILQLYSAKFLFHSPISRQAHCS